MAENITFRMVRIVRCRSTYFCTCFFYDFILDCCLLAWLPDLYLNAGILLQFQEFLECFRRIKIVERRRDNASGIMIVIICKIKKMLLQCLHRTLADERDRHIEILAAFQLFFECLFHGSSVMIGNQSRLIFGIRVIVFLNKTRHDGFDQRRISHTNHFLVFVKSACFPLTMCRDMLFHKAVDWLFDEKSFFFKSMMEMR